MAIAFTGTDKLNVATAIAIPSVGSMAFKFKPAWNSNDGATHGFLGASNSISAFFRCEKYSDNNLYFGWYNSSDYRVSVNCSGTGQAGYVSSGLWYAYVLTWGSGGSTLYGLSNLTGLPVVLGTASAPTTFTVTGEFMMGHYYDTVSITEYFDGALADLGIWNVELTEGEAFAFCKGLSGLCLQPASLISYWPLTGRNSPEIELIEANTGTLTGTSRDDDYFRIFQPHTQIFVADYHTPVSIMAITQLHAGAITGPVYTFYAKDSSSGAYTLTCSTGSYSVIGVDPGLEFGRLSALDIGSYALTGVDPSLKFGRKTTGATGSYVITGIDAALKFGRKLTGDVGSYALSGVDPNLEFGRKTIADTGSYTISGANPTLRATRLIVLDTGSYGLTGVDPNLEFGRKLISDIGLYNLTGTDSSLEFNRLISIATGLYNLTGTNVGLIYGAPGNYTISCDLGTYTISGVDPSLEFNRIMSFDAGSYGLTGIDASLKFGRKVIADTGSYNVTGIDSSLRYSRLASLVTGSYAITGGTLTLRTGKIVSLDAGSYGLSGTSLSFSRNYVISIGIGSYIITGIDATLTGPGADIVEIGEFTLYIQRIKNFILEI